MLQELLANRVPLLLRHGNHQQWAHRRCRQGGAATGNIGIRAKAKAAKVKASKVKASTRFDRSGNATFIVLSTRTRHGQKPLLP